MIKTVWKSIRESASVSGIVAMICTSNLVWGQGDVPPPPPGAGQVVPLSEGEAAAVQGLSPELLDQTFDRYVDLQLLGVAWGSRDSGTLTDLALQFSEGERVLRRSHKAIKASSVFDLAVKMAIETGDKASIARLAKAAEQSGDKERSAQLAVAMKTAGVSRAADPTLTEGTQDALNTIADLGEQIKQARLTENAESLIALEKTVAEHPALSAKHRESLRKVIVETKDAMPAKVSAEAANAAALLEKLSGPSRINVNPFSPEYAGTWRQGPKGHWYRENFLFVNYEIWVWDYNGISRHLCRRGSKEWALVLYGLNSSNGGWKVINSAGKQAYIDANNPCNIYMDNKWQVLPDMLAKGSIVAAGGGNIVAAGGGNLLGKGGAGLIPNPTGSSQIVAARTLLDKGASVIINSTGIVAAGGGN